MLDRVLKRILAAAAAGVLLGAALWAQAQQNWKDRAEYDLYQEIEKATGAKKIELINTWKEKYPNSDFKAQRQQMLVQTYQQTGNLPKALEIAKEMISEDPKGLAGLYWATFLVIPMNNPSPDVLDTGEKAAKGLLENLETIFAPDKKPANMNEAQWKDNKTQTAALAHTTLGWIAMTRKNSAEAQTQFTKALELSPNSGQVSFWLGDVILKDRKPETQSHALYHFARSASVEWPERQKVLAYVEKLYTSFHGSREGLDQIMARAKTNPFPPADFKILSKEEIKLKNEEEFKKSNPMLALWMTIKGELTGPNGQQYFESGVKGTAMPGGANGVKEFKGKVVSTKPVNRPKEIVVAVSDMDTPEVTLKLDEESFMPGKAEPGTEIGFEGVPTSYTKEPFMMIMEVEKDKISGWPKPEPAKPAGKKTGAKGKKK